MAFDLIHITAQYSNAVLVAILPYISDFARKLDLPVQTPILPAHVRSFGCSRNLGDRDFGGGIPLTNGMIFDFFCGMVTCYTTPRNYSEIQDVAEIERFY